MGHPNVQQQLPIGQCEIQRKAYQQDLRHLKLPFNTKIFCICISDAKHLSMHGA